jgi:hypothetical protein
MNRHSQGCMIHPGSCKSSAKLLALDFSMYEMSIQAAIDAVIMLYV